MTSYLPPRSMIGRPPVPPVLLPLTPAPVIPPPLKQRARSTVPETAIRKAAARSWTRQWTGLRVPLIIPGTETPKTGWEGTPIIENLRILAGLPQTAETRELNLDMLPARIRRIYPIKLKPKAVEQISTTSTPRHEAESKNMVESSSTKSTACEEGVFKALGEFGLG
jgi:hypothetical protein